LETPILSLTLLQGLKDSSFATTSAPSPFVTLFNVTSGVFPVNSIMELAIFAILCNPFYQVTCSNRILKKFIDSSHTPGFCEVACGRHFRAVVITKVLGFRGSKAPAAISQQSCIVRGDLLTVRFNSIGSLLRFRCGIYYVSRWSILDEARGRYCLFPHFS